MQPISKPQLQKIHVLVRQIGFADEDKKELIFNLTNGRTQSTRDLSMAEAKHLIAHLCQFDPREKIKSAITSLAYKSGILYGDTPEDKKINMAKLNLFLKQRGAVKKELNYLSYAELVLVQKQFEALLRNTKKTTDKKAHEKQVADLLKELDLQTA